MPASRTARRALSVVVIAMLGVVVGTLSVMALTNSGSAPTASSPPPSMSVMPEPSATATPAVTTPPPAAPVARSEERFLSYSGTNGWRAIAGSCGGEPPLLQRVDGEGTWIDVQPREYALRQIASLDAHRDGAELIGGVDVDCDAASLRTFSAGDAWISYEGALSRSRYVDLADPARVHPGDDVAAAPCPDATGLRAVGDVVALICDGQAWQQNETAWTALPTKNVKALAIDDGDLVLGHVSDNCAGLTISRVSADSVTVVGCAETAETDEPVALAMSSDGVAVWTGDRIVVVSD
ncbi:hypothetical protein [Microbacterium alcoholitolerans]|uniref:hypothetical protein n=1 Tax=unclassified Microbacterium TaxID=2609290 RepID=UPI003D179254